MNLPGGPTLAEAMVETVFPSRMILPGKDATSMQRLSEGMAYARLDWTSGTRCPMLSLFRRSRALSNSSITWVRAISLVIEAK